MRFKILGVLAAVALVSACSTVAEEDMSADTGGEATETAAAATEASSDAAVMENAIEAGSQRDLIVNVGDRVKFEFDRFDLSELARNTLERQAAWLAKNPGVTITIEGHCDERGTQDYNLGLGSRRANSTKDYLVSLGVSSSRIKVISYADLRPVALGSNETAWAENRRAVTVVNGAGS